MYVDCRLLCIGIGEKREGEEMSAESKAFASYLGILFLVFISCLWLLRMTDNKIHKLENKIKAAKQYCIGKENRIDFCRELMSQIK